MPMHNDYVIFAGNDCRRFVAFVYCIHKYDIGVIT